MATKLKQKGAKSVAASPAFFLAIDEFFREEDEFGKGVTDRQGVTPIRRKPKRSAGPLGNSILASGRKTALLSRGIHEDIDHQTKQMKELAGRSTCALVFAEPFHPEEPIMELWDIVMMVLLIYTAFYTTYQVCFLTAEDAGSLALAIDTGVMLAFVADVVIKFNLVTTDDLTNELITNRYLIASKYLKGSFLLDFVSTFPWDLAGTDAGSSPRLIRLLRLMKLLRLLRTSKVTASILKGSNMRMSTFAFYKTLGLAAVVIHWCACVWMLVGTADEESGWKSTYYLSGANESDYDNAIEGIEGIDGKVMLKGRSGWYSVALEFTLASLGIWPFGSVRLYHMHSHALTCTLSTHIHSHPLTSTHFRCCRVRTPRR
jgi:hypothetical protein